MDMQGTPIGSTNQGTKNTSEPSDPIREGAGAVASDSLAADSVRAGGGFSENRDADPLAVKGGQSTLANTDTSAATTLGPASDRQHRDANTGYEESGSGQKYPEGAGGQGSFPGQHSAQGYVGGSSAAKRNFSEDNAGGAETVGDRGYNDSTTLDKNDSTTNPYSSSTSGSGSGSGSGEGRPDVDAAPGYIASVYSEPTKSGKPHGTNITEGGFEADDSKNASFNTEIGSKKDPGRRAEEDFEKINESAVAGGGPRQPGGERGTGVYDTLDTNQKI